MAPQPYGIKKNTPPSPLETALLCYEAGDVVAARAHVKAFAAQTPEAPVEAPALPAKLWPPHAAPSPSPMPSRQAVAQALTAHTRPPLSAYAYALLCMAVAVFLSLVIFFRS